MVTKASYRGIEPVDNLLTTAVMEGGDEPLSLPLVDALLKLPVRSSDSSRELEGEQHLQDAIDEAVVADQALVSSLEQARFQQMLRQLDHYLADQVLLMRRKRAVLDARIEELEKRREKSLSPQVGQETARQVEKLNRDAKRDRPPDRAPGRRRRRGIPGVARTSVRAPLPEAGDRSHSGRAVRDRGQRYGMLKLLHTADLHLGCEFGQLPPDDRRKLARARLAVVEPILALAEQYDVDAVLLAGDIFDTPEPLRGLVAGFRQGAYASGKGGIVRSCCFLAITIR